MTLDPELTQDYRFERKYYIDRLTLHEVECLVERCPACFFKVHPSRDINNIYFDTYDLRSYYENVAGVARREKIRLRWYGELIGRVNRPRLELKMKRGMVGAKRAFDVPQFDVGPGLSRNTLDAALGAAELPVDVASKLEFSAPTLVNRYRRKYYQSSDGKYRITIDSGLRFYSVDRLPYPSLSRGVDPSAVVMELKYDGSIVDLDERIVNFFPFRVTRMSKYVTGIESVA